MATRSSAWWSSRARPDRSSRWTASRTRRLGYANGSGHAEKPADSDIESRRTPNAGRHLHPDDDVGSPGFYQEALVPLGSTTHAGEDVAIYAGGPQAHLFRGTMEQHVVYHVIRRAFGW